MRCPVCNKPNASAGHILGHSGGRVSTPAKRRASRENGRKHKARRK